MLRSFWARYVYAYLHSGDDKPFGDSSDVFEADTIERMRHRLSPQATATQVFFTENLSNRALAGCLSLKDGTQIIAVNARFKVDPEVLAHTLIEEFVHAQQILDGVDFATQRSQFAYDNRPYEQEAKSIATEVLGFEPAEFDAILMREEPDCTLYDNR